MTSIILAAILVFLRAAPSNAAPIAGGQPVHRISESQAPHAAAWTKVPGVDQTSLTIETSDIFNLNPGNSYKFKRPSTATSAQPTTTVASAPGHSAEHLLAMTDAIQASTSRAVLAIGSRSADSVATGAGGERDLLRHPFEPGKAAGRYQYDGSNIMSKRTCYNYCLDTYNSSHIIDTDRLSSGIYAEKIYDRRVISEFCKIYRNQQNCLHGCGIPFRALSEAFSVHDFLCIQHYEEFLRSISCYRLANNSVATECYPKCGSTGVLQNLAVDVQRAQMRSDMSSLIRLTSEICGYTRCIIDCQTPIIYTICGDLRPANLLRLFMNASMEQSVRQLRKVGKAHLLPQSCRDFLPWTTTTVQIAGLRTHPAALSTPAASTAGPHPSAAANYESWPPASGDSAPAIGDDVNEAAKSPQLSWQLIVVCSLLSMVVCFNCVLMIAKLPCR